MCLPHGHSKYKRLLGDKFEALERGERVYLVPPPDIDIQTFQNRVREFLRRTFGHAFTRRNADSGFYAWVSVD